MQSPKEGRRATGAVIVAAATGLLVGLWAGQGVAERAVPAEHLGLTVRTLGVVTEQSVAAQLALAGHRLQLREITIAPGGQIARHSHETRPGLVRMLSGSWVEGRPGGERTITVGGDDIVIEDAGTVHWFWNAGEEPATALVCDIVPAG